MATINFTLDDALANRLVTAYCSKYDYTDNAQQTVVGTRELPADFTARMMFHEMTSLLYSVESQPAMQAAAATVQQTITNQTFVATTSIPGQPTTTTTPTPT